MALTDELGGPIGALPTPPISMNAIEELLAVRPELTLDGRRPTREQLLQRVAGFWFPDEVVLYVGLAGSRKSPPTHGELATRVCEYYVTPLGASRPHAGGWPLKTLACLHDVHVHYAYCDNVNEAERRCIASFAEHVSPKTRASLHDPVRVMPFANLEFPKGNAKAHGIRGARAPKEGPATRDTAGVSPGSEPKLGLARKARNAR